MRGIATFWKESRISKIIAVILPFPFLLVALLLSPVEVFASASGSSSTRDYNSFELTVTDQGITSTGKLFPVALLDDEGLAIYDLAYHEDHSLAPKIDGYLNVLYSGIVSISHAYQFQTLYEDGQIYHDAYLVGFISDNVVLNVANSVPSGGPNLGNASITRISIEGIETSTNYNGNTNPRLSAGYNQNITAWDMADFQGEFISSGTIRHNYNLKVNVIVHYETDSQNFDVDFDKLAISYVDPAVSSTYASCIAYGSFYNMREILEGLDTKLFNVWTNTNLIYNQLVTINQNNVSGYNSIVHAIQQLDMSNSVDVQQIIDLMTNNNSGVAEVSDTVRQNLETANAAADVAVDNAVHDYDSEFTKLKNKDTSAFFTAQSSAVTFWRDLGEWILNSNNIGFLATGLIICTLITVFVFLLRL